MGDCHYLEMAICCSKSTDLEGCLAHTESLTAGCADIPEITPRAAGMMGLKVGFQHLGHILGVWQLCMQKRAGPSLHRTCILALRAQLHSLCCSSQPCIAPSCLRCSTVPAPHLHCRVCLASRLEVANTVEAQVEVEGAAVEAKTHGRPMVEEEVCSCP